MLVGIVIPQPLKIKTEKIKSLITRTSYLFYYIIDCKKLLQKMLNKNHLSKLDMLE